MRMNQFYFVFGLSLFLSTGLFAQSIVNPAYKLGQSQIGLDFGFSFSDIEYEGDNGGQVDIDRKTLAAAVAFGMNPYTDIVFQAGMIFESDFEGDDDQGFLFGGGVRGLVYEEDQIKVYGLGELIYVLEDYGDNLEGSHLAINLEANVRWSPNERVDIYGGIGLVPFSDGEVEAGGADFDIERDDLFSIRIGASFAFGNNFFVRPDVKIVGEQTFTLAAGKAL